jgi:hypothetical protein
MSMNIIHLRGKLERLYEINKGGIDIYAAFAVNYFL